MLLISSDIQLDTLNYNNPISQVFKSLISKVNANITK